MGKGEDWKDSETECLIAIWREPHVQQTLTNSKRNIHVYQQISETLGKVYGIDRSGESCRSKVKNMKSWYKREKEKRSVLPEGSDVCKDSSLFHLMEEVLYSDPTLSGSRHLFPTGLVSNLNKHDSAFLSGKDDFQIVKTEAISGSESELDSLEISDDKDENFYLDNGRREAAVEVSNQGETTPSHLDSRGSILGREGNALFNSKNVTDMEIQNCSKVNDVCGLEISSSQKDQQLKLFSSAQNKKHVANFQTKPETRSHINRRNKQMNSIGIRNRTVGTNNFYHSLRRQARKNLVSRWSHFSLANKRQRINDNTQSQNCNSFQHTEPKNTVLTLSPNRNNFQLKQVCHSEPRTSSKSSDGHPVAKETHPKDWPDQQNTLVGIANKHLSELVEKLVESERQHLALRQKEADVELQDEREGANCQ
ncbi:uncharacterized protein LOC121379154 isoform X2 [Gigantopelta aegis]|uniref:uncharacterized protein LOC121379154 isoform X2 n=1 Tax=Gigantopelta aegis TaxID=1735272 RepID=UPI001B88A804|nr:uncharacterized protein LOC121379154 isoform X2 [Gigantopelta aegis]XP_041363579.1 uncharacterized protein LOC121379154 isoform X2 [Gigantopelta aegis]